MDSILRGLISGGGLLLLCSPGSFLLAFGALRLDLGGGIGVPLFHRNAIRAAFEAFCLMTSLRSTGLRKLNAFFRDAIEPVFLLDTEGRIIYVNPACEALTGRALDSFEAVETGSVNGLLSIPALQFLFSPPAEVYQGQSRWGRLLVSRPDRSTLWCRVEYSPFHDQSGSLLGVMGLLRDDQSATPQFESDALKMRAALDDARQSVQLRYGQARLIGSGLRHDRLAEQIATAATVRSSVFIVGERGTGRRLVAELIHAQRLLPASPFLPVDVEALTAEQIMRTLIAFEASPDSSSPPTLFLSNADTLPRDVQQRLVGDLRHERIRLIASIAVDPDEAYREGRFREDFFFAMTSLVLQTAPLRERIEEIPLLAQHFLEQADGPVRQIRRDFSKEAFESLAAYDWPGNVAELARVVQVAAASTADRQVTRSNLPAAIFGEVAAAYAPPNQPPTIMPMDEWLTRIERQLIEKALEKARHNKSRAAELLDISRPRLYRRIKELGIDEAGDGDEPSD